MLTILRTASPPLTTPNYPSLPNSKKVGEGRGIIAVVKGGGAVLDNLQLI